MSDCLITSVATLYPTLSEWCNRWTVAYLRFIPTQDNTVGVGSLRLQRAGRDTLPNRFSDTAFPRPLLHTMCAGNRGRATVETATRTCEHVNHM